VCVLLEKRTWGRESVCASSVTDRGEVWLGIGAGGVERQTAGATRWTGGERVRCARVCESSTSSTKGGGSAFRSWVSVCVLGRGRGAPEKKWSSVQTKDALPRASLLRCEQMRRLARGYGFSFPRFRARGRCVYVNRSGPGLCVYVNRCSTLDAPPPDKRFSRGSRGGYPLAALGSEDWCNPTSESPHFTNSSASLSLLCEA